ncbi:hypothetical protein F5882DRAFT_373706 [Hyaloscypha sp. PMI_1271]|nr:hypothetical protein F5882DRAFT_373706 [Hyaloscypha sp. PMI_1271]
MALMGLWKAPWWHLGLVSASTFAAGRGWESRKRGPSNGTGCRACITSAAGTEVQHARGPRQRAQSDRQKRPLGVRREQVWAATSRRWRWRWRWRCQLAIASNPGVFCVLTVGGSTSISFGFKAFVCQVLYATAAAAASPAKTWLGSRCSLAVIPDYQYLRAARLTFHSPTAAARIFEKTSPVDNLRKIPQHNPPRGRWPAWTAAQKSSVLLVGPTNHGAAANSNKDVVAGWKPPRHVKPGPKVSRAGVVARPTMLQLH